MDCLACGHQNREGARFCAQCAASLIEAPVCPRCGASNILGARFCDACGQSLVEGPATKPSGLTRAPDPRAFTPDYLADKIRSGKGVLEGERKHVTVLFADVLGSMELAEQSDPEQWQRTMERLFAILSGGVHRFEGTVDKFTGDGIMALFGAPIAHENHAQRACYAALRLQDELAAYAAELRRTEGLSLSVRIGINSGQVVVGAIGDDLAMEYTAIGHTVGLAQRMESLAEPGKVYLTQHTALLVEGYVALRDLGKFRVKGASNPLNVYELTGIGSARGRLDVARARGFSRFVGRAEEMEVLERALERSVAGEAQVIGIVGEAGVGKSRLCHEFAQRARAHGLPIYHVAAQPHAQSVPLLPVLQLMRAYFDINEVDSGQTARERIAGKLLLLDERFADDLPLLFDFLGVPDPDRPPPRMDPEARQRQLLALTRRLIRAQNRRQPGVSVFEDLHWMDPASEKFLANNVDALQGVPGLVVANFRPEYRADWMSKSYYRQIALVPLSAAAIEEMLGDLLGGDPSLNQLPKLIRERTGGNPFFIEEVVQALVEGGNLEGDRGAYRLVRPVKASAVPASVEALLAARIDRLAPREKAVLHAAAVIGKEFAEPVLARVVDLDRSELEDALRGLLAGEFVFEQELYPEAIYAFKHPLTQEVAYSSQLSARRAPMHASVAAAISELYPDRLDERAALLAGHWEAAGDKLAAARCHAQAAAWSGTTDPNESSRHWRRVKELAGELPETGETIALGITARLFALQFAWRLGISHEEAEQVFSEAERMARKAGDLRSRALLLSIYGLIRGSNDGDTQAFLTLARQAAALAEESEDAALYLTVGPGSAYALFLSGEYRAAAAVLERALELANGDATVGAGGVVGCPYANALIFNGGYRLYLGEMEQGCDLIEQGINVAREHGDIEVVAWGHMWRTFYCYLSGEPEPALGHAQQTLEIAERIGDSFSRSQAWFFFGLAQQLRGEWQQAIQAIERSQTIARERRTALETQPWRLVRLAESHLALGDPDRARRLVEEGVDLARRGAQAGVEALGWVTLARVLLASARQDAQAEIAGALDRALELANTTEAKIIVPRVHVERADLARLTGNEDGHHRELREAHRLYSEMGAVGHAQRLADELATSPR